jgi:DNA-binding response OmpR family regulator
MPESPRSVRILVVEDEYMLADALADGLTALGVQVVGPVGRLDEALALTAASELDGAILDINLGGEAVFPLADALAAREVPYVFATGYGRESIPKPYREHPILSKPVDVAALKSLLGVPTLD